MRILITSGRAPASLELIRLLKLGGHEVHVADSFAVHLSRRSKGVFKNHLVPPPRQQTMAYGQALQEIVQSEKIELIIPTFEETFWVSFFKHQLEQFCPVFVDELDKLRTLHDKSLFIKLCHSLNLKAPRSFELTSLEQLHETAKDFSSFVLKPSFSRFGEDVLIKPELRQLEKLDISPNRTWVIQEFLSGPAFCSYAICRQGRVLASAIYPSEIKSNKVSLNFSHSENKTIHQWVQNFAQKTQYTGQLSFDFIDSASGLMPIECNPRMTSGLHLFENRRDFHKIFLQDPSQVLKPEAHVKNMMGILVVMYGLSDVRNLFSNIKIFRSSNDIIFRRNDIMPFIDQFKAFFWLAKESKRQGVSLSKLTTADIEWNGESS